MTLSLLTHKMGQEHSRRAHAPGVGTGPARDTQDTVSLIFQSPSLGPRYWSSSPEDAARHHRCRTMDGTALERKLFGLKTTMSVLSGSELSLPRGLAMQSPAPSSAREGLGRWPTFWHRFCTPPLPSHHRSPRAGAHGLPSPTAPCEPSLAKARFTTVSAWSVCDKCPLRGVPTTALRGAPLYQERGRWRTSRFPRKS